MKQFSHKTHERYSPNLYSWLRKHGGIERNRVWIDKATRKIMLIGWVDDDRWFHGCGLKHVLCSGARETPMCRTTWTSGSIIAKDFEPIENFWGEYARIGRCAIDKDHTEHFINADNRWAYDVSGKQRTCQWCCHVKEHTQLFREWDEVVKRTAWFPQSDTLSA